MSATAAGSGGSVAKVLRRPEVNPKDYLLAKNVPVLVDDLVRRLVESQPEDPKAFIRDLFPAPTSSGPTLSPSVAPAAGGVHAHVSFVRIPIRNGSFAEAKKLYHKALPQFRRVPGVMPFPGGVMMSQERVNFRDQQELITVHFYRSAEAAEAASGFVREQLMAKLSHLLAGKPTVRVVLACRMYPFSDLRYEDAGELVDATMRLTAFPVRESFSLAACDDFGSDAALRSMAVELGIRCNAYWVQDGKLMVVDFVREMDIGRDLPRWSAQHGQMLRDADFTKHVTGEGQVLCGPGVTWRRDPATEFFIVEHHLKEGKAAEYWQAIQGLMGDAQQLTGWLAKHKELGMHCHTFMPTAVSEPSFCVWEAQEGISKEEFQRFIDGPFGPSMGMLENTVHRVAPELGGASPFIVSRFAITHDGGRRKEAVAEQFYAHMRRTRDTGDDAAMRAWFARTHADDCVCSFPDAGLTIPVGAFASLFTPLFASFPDGDFDQQVRPTQLSDGTVVSVHRFTGTHSGAPWAPPGLPPVAAAGVAVANDAERFALHFAPDGRVCKYVVTVVAGGKGLSGPPGIYAQIGGTVPGPAGAAAPPAAQPAAPPAAPAGPDAELAPAGASSFVIVKHTFLPGRAAGWWEAGAKLFGNPTYVAAKEARETALGLHNHSFLPCGTEGPVFCVWECRAGMSKAQFQAFIDGADSPCSITGSCALHNEVRMIDPALGGLSEAEVWAPKFARTAQTVIDHTKPTTVKCMGNASAAVTKVGGKQAMRISIKPPFCEADWKREVGAKMPGCPEWCPASHFGYLESGTMKVRYQDGTVATVRAGDTYLIPPGHLPIVDGDETAVMIEFAQETATLIAAHGAPGGAPAPGTAAPRCAPCATVIDHGRCDTRKEMGGAVAQVTKAGGKQAMRIVLQPGFDWKKDVGPRIPGCPASCPATHFGYLASGTMGVTYDDGSKEVVKAGDTYLITPGHLPTIQEGEAVMIEFSEDTAALVNSLKEQRGTEAPRAGVPHGEVARGAAPMKEVAHTGKMG